MAYISVTNSFANGATADADAVNQNFTDIINGTSDGTKDLNVNAITAAGAATFNGDVTLGNATGDDIVINGYIAADIDPKTTNVYALGATGRLFKETYSSDFFASLGALATPSHSFDGDANTGMWSSAADIVNFSCGGTEVLELDTSSIDTPVRINCAGVTSTAIIYLPTGGSAAGPSLAFADDVDVGIWSSGTNTLNFSAGSVEMLEFNSTGAVFNDASADLDFRVEASGRPNALSMNGADGTWGMGVAYAANTTLKIKGTDDLGTSYSLHLTNNAGSTDTLKVSNLGIFTVQTASWASSATQDMGVSASGAVAVFQKFTSSRRYKEKIENYEFGTDWIYKLDPKTFRYINDNPEALASNSVGYIAEEVSKIAPKEFVFWTEKKNEAPIEESLHYKLFVVPIIEEMKILKRKVELLERKV